MITLRLIVVLLAYFILMAIIAVIAASLIALVGGFIFLVFVLCLLWVGICSLWNFFRWLLWPVFKLFRFTFFFVPIVLICAVGMFACLTGWESLNQWCARQITDDQTEL